ncbi:MAG: ABC-2 family transporter protein [Lentisphaerae bacterium ADurb.BinA184]|nr:MAG: ABC-2 family transporter protein [Lentisphaerae bacterium ADurb.BinA184]
MSTCRSIYAVAKRELVSYFDSPVAYVFIIIFLALNGFFTFMVSDFFARGQADLRPMFFWHPWLYLILVPAVGMRLWAEERRSGSMELLLTLPITAWQAIVAKFLAAWLFLALALALTFPMVITVCVLGDPDGGAIVSGYVGSLLLAGVYLAVSMAMSSLTRSQVVSFVCSVVVCLLLVLAGWPPVTGMFEKWAGRWLVDGVAAFSVMPHFEDMQRGVIDSRDVIYCASVIVFFLFFTAVVIRNRRRV